MEHQSGYTTLRNFAVRSVVFLLICSLVLGSFFNVRKADAIAPVVAGGAAVAALAAELGISETALIAAVGAVAVGATGLAMYQANGTDTSLPPAPGFKPWDSLSPDDQSLWGSNDVGEDLPTWYQKQSIAWWAMQYGLLETGDNGSEPTPEPDPGTPEHEKWQKARNVIIALAAGGGAVAFNEAVGPLIDNGTAALKELLFGTGDDSLALPISYTGTVAGASVPFVFASGGVGQYQGSYNLTFTDTGIFQTSWYGSSTSSYNRCAYFDYPVASDLANLEGVLVKYTRATRSGSYYFQLSGASYGDNTDSVFSILNLTTSNAISSGGRNFLAPSGNAWNGAANLNFGGTYQFYNGSSLVGEFSNGAWTVPPSDLDIDYGQLSDTPDELPASVFNNNTYQTFVNNYTNPDVDGFTRTLTVPDALLNGDTIDPSYDDFVSVTPNDDVQFIPGDKPLSPGDDVPDTPQTDYEKDFGERVGELLAQPFDNLFPFCLIGDLRRFTDIVSEAAYSGSGEDLNGTDSLEVPLSGFAPWLDDVSVDFDLALVSDFAGYVRPWLTALFVVGLLVGSFRFFLTRGGE